MQRLKKFITASVLGMSVLSMTVVVSPVKAATIVDGDLIKTKTNSAVYYVKGNSRYVFPNENTYRTWFVNSAGKADFKSVTIKTVTDAEKNALTLAGVVRFRPGTAIYKFSATDTAMYAVEPNGVLRLIDATQAATIYGTNWQNLVFIGSEFSVGDYTKGTALPTGTYPIGTVLNPTGTSDLYYWDGTNYRKFANDSALLANGMSFKYVVKTATAITAAGAAITGSEAAINNTTIAMTGGTTGSTVVSGTGSGLTVALASDTPAAATYIRDNTNSAPYPAQIVAPFTKINFTASNDGDVVVSTVKLTRSGISADTDLSNVYLYDGNTKLAEYTSFSSKVITFTNSAGLFTVPKGTTKTITVKADIASNSTVYASTVSGIVLGLAAASDVTAGTAVVSGSFPVNGNTMAVGTVTDLGYLNIATVNTTNFPATVDPGVTGYELFRFNVTANDQQMNLESLKLTVVGTVGTNDITNFILKDTAGTQIGATIPAMNAAKELIFDASASPYTITSGQTKTLVVYGDVPLGSGRAFRFTIRKVSDVVVKDNGYGIYTAPSYSSAAFTLIDPDSTGDGTNINNGTITSGIATDTPVGNIAGAATGVTVAKFTLKANGEDVKVANLHLTMTESSGVNLKNGKLYWDGSQVGLTDADVTSGADVNFTVNQVIKAGTTATVSYVVDTIHYDTAGDSLAGHTVVTALVASTTDATGQSSLANVAITAATGKTLSISAGTLNVTKNLAFADMSTAAPTGVKGALSVKVASMIITAGTGEGSAITQIAVRDNNASHVTNESFGHNFQNLKLMTGTTQLGTTQGTLAHAGGDVYTFNVSPAYNLGAGQQMVVDVYADILSAAPGYNPLGNAIGLESASVTGTGLLTSAATTDTNAAGNTTLQKIYISANGNLTVTANSLDAFQAVMGSTENTVGSFNFNASTSSEAVNISKITLTASAISASYSNIKFYDGTTLLGTVASFAADDTATLNLATNWVIPKGEIKVLTVKVDVNNSDNATSSTATTFSLADTAAHITAIGAGSGTAITETVTAATGAVMTPVKTKLTVTTASGSPSGAASPSAGQVVAIFNFANSSNVASQAATVTDLALTISTSGTWTQWALASTKSITIRKNSSSGTLLGTSAPQGAPISVPAATGWDGATLTDFDIAAGSSVNLYVIVDTSNAPSAGHLTASLAAGSVTWNDGTSAGTGITTVNSLPILGGTLTY